MKIFNYSEFLLESIGSKVYHFTYLHSLVNILKENALQTTPVMGTYSDEKINKNKFYYFSTTSSRHSSIGYARAQSKSGMVRLNLNGDRLNQKYKGSRVDYWNRPKDPNDPMYKNYKGQELYNMISRQDELEDRIMTDEPLIKGADNYIDSIHILIDIDHYQFKRMYKELLEIYKLSEQFNIPIHLYKDDKSFNHEISKNEINLNDLDVDLEGTEEDSYRRSTYLSFTRVLGLMFIGDPELKSKLIEGLSEIDNVKDFLEVSGSSFDSYIERIEKYSKEDKWNYLMRVKKDFKQNDYPISEYISVVSNDIHNSKNSSSNEKRFVIHELSLDMRKHNCKNIYEYVKYKVELTYNDNI